MPSRFKKALSPNLIVKRRVVDNTNMLFTHFHTAWHQNRLLRKAICLVAVLCVTVACSPQVNALQLQVIDPYLEMHTGPGRGYPIFHTVERDAVVDVVSRRTNWYFVRDHRQREGWVKRESLGRTLASTGIPAALPDTRHGDYLKSQMRVGFTVGQQEQAETTTGVFGYRLSNWLGVEAEGGQIFGESIDGYTYGASVMAEPFGQWKIAPFVSYGRGKQLWEKKEKLQVGSQQQHNSDYDFTGIGLNYYIGFNFLVRAEMRAMKVKGRNDTVSNTAWRIGFNSFF